MCSALLKTLQHPLLVPVTEQSDPLHERVVRLLDGLRPAQPVVEPAQHGVLALGRVGEIRRAPDRGAVNEEHAPQRTRALRHRRVTPVGVGVRRVGGVAHPRALLRVLAPFACAEPMHSASPHTPGVPPAGRSGSQERVATGVGYRSRRVVLGIADDAEPASLDTETDKEIDT